MNIECDVCRPGDFDSVVGVVPDSAASSAVSCAVHFGAAASNGLSQGVYVFVLSTVFRLSCTVEENCFGTVSFS